MKCVLFFYIVGSLVAIASYSMSQSNRGFSISPQSVNTTENSTASFYCRHRDELHIDWLVNGTTWHLLPTEVVTIKSYFDVQRKRVILLNMTAWPITNNSVIQCVANHSIHSEPALLLIQGLLQQVTNLTVEIADHSLIIQWRAPFSLTSTEITYCVDMYNSTDQTLDTSICGLNETQYKYEAMSDPSPCDGVDIYVIPANGAGNGSRNHIIGTIYERPGSIVASNLNNLFISDDGLQIQVSNISDLDICYCSVCLKRLTEGLSTDACYNASHDDNQMSVFLNRIEWNQIYTMRIILHNAAGSTSSNGSLKLSTHDVQSITIHSTIISGKIEVDVHFLRHSLARGCLLILSQAQYTGYFAIKKESGREVQSIQIENLPEGEYTVRGYDIESDGLPNHPTPAVILHNFTLTRGSTFWNQIIISTRLTIYADNVGNICINCTISSQSDALGCVVLLNPVNNLNNITVREINKSAQQPYCIYVGGRNTFSVSVFEWKSDGFVGFQPVTLNKITTVIQDYTNQPETLSTIQIFQAAAGGGSAAVIICLLCLCSIILISKLKRKDMQSGTMAMNNNVAYAVPEIHVTDSEAVYESID